VYLAWAQIADQRRAREHLADVMWQQGAEQNRTQPIVMRFTGREGDMDRQPIGVHHHVDLAR